MGGEKTQYSSYFDYYYSGEWIKDTVITQYPPEDTLVTLNTGEWEVIVSESVPTISGHVVFFHWPYENVSDTFVMDSYNDDLMHLSQSFFIDKTWDTGVTVSSQEEENVETSYRFSK